MNSRSGLALAALPLLLLIACVITYSVNMPIWDQWELVPLIQKMREGTLDLGDLFALHNEHRLFFPRIIMLLLAHYSHWNVYYEMAASIFLAITTFYFFAKMAKESLPRLWPISLVLISIILFSTNQWDNWLWGWQIQWFLNVLAVIITLWALSEKRIYIAMIAAIVATYSLGNGLFIWFAAIPLFFTDPRMKKKLLPWSIVGAITIGLFFVSYNMPSYPSKTYWLYHLDQALTYSILYLSRPISTIHSSYCGYIIMGTLYLGIVGAYLAWFWNKERTLLIQKLLPWICLGIYALCTAEITMISRVGFDVISQAREGRYITISSLLLMMICIVIFSKIECTKKRAPLSITLVVVFGFLALLGNGEGIQKSRIYHQKNSTALVHLQKASSCEELKSDFSLLPYPCPELLWERLCYLRSIEWGDLNQHQQSHE